MSRLFLVKHALPEIAPDVPAKLWQLGEAGRAQSEGLAERLFPYHPGVVITSKEPKAAETGGIVAQRLELPCATALGLHEQDITGMPYFENPEAFEEAVRSLFAEPDKRAYGNESADEALRRFEDALVRALEPYPDKDVVIVTHGRVGTLFVAAYNPVKPFTFWKDWKLSTFALLSRPDYKLLNPPNP